MFQVCFMACFAEEGKGNRKEYSIYYYARANSRASVPCRKSVQKQGSRRFSINRKGRKREKVPEWLEKTRQAASVKCERFQMKIGMTGKKDGKSLYKTGRKKCFGNQKIPEWLIKKRQAASTKCERFQMKIGMTGKKHGRRLHKTNRKKAPETPNTGMAGKNTASGIRKMQKIPDEKSG